MNIELLADRPEFISLLAEWHQAEWAYFRPGFSLEDRKAKLRSAAGRTQPPVVFIATDEERLLGSAMLVANNMDTRPDLSPWLAGVVTAPEFRRQGIASALSRRVVQHAASLGFSRLYLFTPSGESFYARLGWIVVERTRYRETDVTVMSHDETGARTS